MAAVRVAMHLYLTSTSLPVQHTTTVQNRACCLPLPPPHIQSARVGTQAFNHPSDLPLPALPPPSLKKPNSIPTLPKQRAVPPQKIRKKKKNRTQTRRDMYRSIDQLLAPALLTYLLHPPGASRKGAEVKQTTIRTLDRIKIARCAEENGIRG